MLKQSPSRNPRSKGLKVKHVLQICVLLATSIWVLHQVKHLYGKRIKEEMQEGNEIMKLGRKDLLPQIKDASSLVDRLGNGVDENKLEEMMDDGVGGGDDEIDGHDQEPADEEESEEVEDLIDVDDRERDDRSEEKDDETEDGSLLDDQVEKEGEKAAEDAGDEENFRTISTIFQIGGLRMLKEAKVDSEDIASMQRKETSDAKDVIVDINNSDPKVGMNEVTEFLSSENAVNNEENDYKVRLGSVDAAPNSSSMPVFRSLEASNGQSIAQESYDNQDASADWNHITLPDVHSKQNGSFNKAVETEQPSSTLYAMTEQVAAASASESLASRNGSETLSAKDD